MNLNLRPEVRREWENLRKHDVCFLLTVRPPSKIGTFYDFQERFVPQVSLVRALHVTNQSYTSALCHMLVFRFSDQFSTNCSLCAQVGLTYVRGCEIEGMLDANGRVIEEGDNFTN